MTSRPARYSAAVAGSSGCAGSAPGTSAARTAVSVITNSKYLHYGGPVARLHSGGGPDDGACLRLFVGDDRADPVPETWVAPDQPDRVEDEHHDEAYGDPREPAVRLGLRRLEQVVDGDGNRDHAKERQDHMLEDAELLRPVLAVVERQRHVGSEVHERDQDRAHRAGLEEEGQRVQAVAVPADPVTEGP